MEATTFSSKEVPVNQSKLMVEGSWNRFVRRASSARNNFSKTPATMKLFLENVYGFAESTSLHGCKFIGNRNISYFERIFFLIAFIASLAVCSNFIMNIYEKWTSTPVIIARSASSTYISDIPFPAITICNMNQALKSKVAQLSRNSTQYQIMLILCNREDRIRIQNFTTTWSEYELFLAEMTQRCHQMLVLCRYATITFNCTNFIRPVLTNEGRCCSFNVVDPSFMYLKDRPTDFKEFEMPSHVRAIDWTPEVGYPDKSTRRSFPVKAFGAGDDMGLTLILNADVSEYFCSSTNGAGFKVRLHAPTETPNVGDSGFPLPVGFETRAVIIPQLSDASDSIRSMHKTVRNCVFSNEANLTYFRTYSSRSCEMECEARLVAEECKCLVYYMPRIRPDISICGVKDTECFKSAILKAQTTNQEFNNCSRECMAPCFDLTYSVLTYSSPIEQGKFQIREKLIQNMTPGYAEENIAVVHFYYTDNAFRSSTKEQFVGFTEFLSNIGGILGLFTGFSFISLVEVFYYATFRPYCAYRLQKKQVKKVVPAITTISEKFHKSSKPLQRIEAGKLILFSTALDHHLVGRKFRPIRGLNKGRRITAGSSYES